MTEGDGYKPDLVGKRVRHNCDDPECTLQGVVMDVIPNPDKPLDGESLEWCVVVKFDAHKDLPPGISQAFPLSDIKVIEDG